MIIAVNTRTISGSNATNELLIKHILELALLHAEYEFVLITEKEIANFTGLSNVKQHVLSQQSDSVLLWKLWYHYKVPNAIRKLKANVLLSTDGVFSKRIKVPQYLLVSDVGFLSFPELYPANYARFAKLNSRDFFTKSKKLIALSDYLKTQIAQQYKINESKMIVWRPGVFHHPAVGIKDASAIKALYTDDKDYFLFYGPIEERSRLVNILRAFSLFKKRLRTGMQLVIAAPEIPEDSEFVKSLSLYKYREDVKLLTVKEEETFAALIGAAYASINLSPATADIFFLLQSMQYGVPVIAGNFHAAIGLLGQAALLSDPQSPDMIAEKMMSLYKDEKKRNELINEGLAVISDYDEKKAISNLGNILLQ